MSTSELISKAAEYTERFVNAAIPVAKKAYEIGLLTIQIDAVQTLLVPLAWLIAWICIMVYLFKWCKQYDYTKLPDNNLYHWDKANQRMLFWWMKFVSWLLLIPIMACLLNIWLWIKLFHPDLWLAKQAIEKVLEVAK